MGRAEGNTPSQRSGPQMKFLVSVMDTWDEKLVIICQLCQKLHICTYNRQNISGDRPPLETPSLHCPPGGARNVPVLHSPYFGLKLVQIAFAGTATAASVCRRYAWYACCTRQSIAARLVRGQHAVVTSQCGQFLPRCHAVHAPCCMGAICTCRLQRRCWWVIMAGNHGRDEPPTTTDRTSSTVVLEPACCQVQLPLFQ